MKSVQVSRHPALLWIKVDSTKNNDFLDSVLDVSYGRPILRLTSRLLEEHVSSHLIMTYNVSSKGKAAITSDCGSP